MRRPLVIAHRGGRAWAPENTLAAFKKAIDAGCDGIEIDVHRCATGELVVIHDPNLVRTTNGVGLIADASLAELKRLSAGIWFDQEYATERIQTLEEVLEFVDGRTQLVIEVKNAPIEYDGVEQDLLEIISHYAHPEKLIISSYDHVFMRRFYERDSGVSTALLAACIFTDIGAYAEKIGAKFWHPKFEEINEDSVKAAHAAGLKINSFTLNNSRAWSRAIAWGIEGIITDEPAPLLASLESVAEQFTSTD